eukprot:5980925-Pyramimonas_sp.AAC.1
MSALCPPGILRPSHERQLARRDGPDALLAGDAEALYARVVQHQVAIQLRRAHLPPGEFTCAGSEFKCAEGGFTRVEGGLTCAGSGRIHVCRGWIHARRGRVHVRRG